jgi:hypothetical protein
MYHYFDILQYRVTISYIKSLSTRQPRTDVVSEFHIKQFYPATNANTDPIAF